MSKEIKKAVFREEGGKSYCMCCGKELQIHDIVRGSGLCLDCAYFTREIDIENIVDTFPVRPNEVVTNKDGTLTVLIYRRPTLEECGY